MYESRRRWGAIQVSVGVSGQPEVPGRLEQVDITAGQATVFLPGSGGVPIGREVVLRFKSEEGESVAKLPAFGEEALEREDFREYHFRLLETPEGGIEIPQKLRTLLDRRGATRVQPDPDEPVEVILDPGWGPEVVQTDLVDLSANGLAARGEIGAETRLADSKEVSISFRLPGQVEPMNLAGIVASRRVDASSVVYGIEFDRENTQIFDHLQEEITEYIMLRSVQSGW